MSAWSEWVHHPQRVFVRRALFQIHLWTGVLIAVYLFAVCLTGSILVYRNELYRAFSPAPVAVGGTGPALVADALRAAASQVYPEYEVDVPEIGERPAHALELRFRRGDESFQRLFDPFTGRDLGNPLPVGFRATAWMLDLHDNLLAGPTGRRVNGAASLVFVIVCLTGAVVWWAGLGSWRRSLAIDFRANWRRFNWTVHSALGFWTFLFLLMWAVTGAFLGLQPIFAEMFDYLQPLDETTMEERVVDRIQYWLTYLHFGRLGGRGIPWCGRGLCNEVTKAIWAIVGLVPVLMVVTGTVMWWNRVVSPALRRSERAASRRVSNAL